VSATSFGRVDDELNVFVKDGEVERRVGQVPGSTSEDAMAFFVRKFDELAGQVRLLEQRVAAKADPASLIKTVEKLSADLVEPSVVGDIQALRDRVTKISPQLEELRAAKKEASKEAIATATAAREEIVAKAEAMVAGDLTKVIWKTASAEMTALFDQWQNIQKSSVRLPKAEADALWKRFSAARNKFDTAKRGFFSAQDGAVKAARAKKNEIVAEAEALVGSDAVVEYRKLLENWKAAGRTPGKGDDALWERFKAAGDKIYSAKAEKTAEISASQTEALAAKLLLLEEAKKIDAKSNLPEAKRLLLDIQKRWEKAGRVSREALRETDDKLRAIEKSVRDEEQEQWRKSDPATKARTSAVVEQLEDSIAKLKKQLDAANATKDAKKIDDAKSALEAREAWLKVVLEGAN
jgi:hypothetical protein